MSKLAFGSAEERGKAQNKIAALILAGIFIGVVPTILSGYIVPPTLPGQGMTSASQYATWLIQGLQWVGGILLTLGFIWTGIVLRVSGRKRTE